MSPWNSVMQVDPVEGKRKMLNWQTYKWQRDKRWNIKGQWEKRDTNIGMDHKWMSERQEASLASLEGEKILVRRSIPWKEN